MKKYSKQRQLIIESLKSRRDHPTAEKLFIDLKEQMPELGIATVYRNLTELYEEGIITKIKSKAGADRYDANEIPHIHFECKKCGSIEDMYLEKEAINQIEKITKQLAKEKELKCEEVAIYLNGLCKKCSKSIAIV